MLQRGCLSGGFLSRVILARSDFIDLVLGQVGQSCAVTWYYVNLVKLYLRLGWIIFRVVVCITIGGTPLSFYFAARGFYHLGVWRLWEALAGMGLFCGCYFCRIVEGSVLCFYFIFLDLPGHCCIATVSFWWSRFKIPH